MSIRRRSTLVLTLLAGCSWFEVEEEARTDAAPPGVSGRLVVSSLAAGDELGSAVAAAPDRIAVGAPGDDGEGGAAGAVRIFAPGADGWSEESLLVADDARAGDRFGAALALSGDLLAVGAPGRDDAGSSSGAVYVFERDGAAWRRAAVLAAPDASAGDQFGSAVAFVDPDLLAIGAPGHDGDQLSAGAAYLFQREADIWVPLRSGEAELETSE